MRKERGQYLLIYVAYRPTPCMHCDNAPCIKAAKEGAVKKREDGIVLIDPEKAKGQRDILKACPYNAIWWNEEKDVPQKCTFCAHLLDEGWKEPRCVQACPTGALRVVYEADSEMKRIVKAEMLEVLSPEYNSQPRIYYKNLYRFTRCFIGGSVAFKRDDMTECAEGAGVTLFKDSEKVNETLTDNFGDFKFDDLKENSGVYTLELLFKDYESKILDVELKQSVNVGEVYFEK